MKSASTVRVVLALAVLLLPRPARAHHNPLSALTLAVEPATVRMVLVVPVEELATWQPPAPGETPEGYAAGRWRRSCATGRRTCSRCGSITP